MVRFHMDIPNSNGFRIPAREQERSRLTPFCDHTTPLGDLQDILQASERADHLYGGLVHGGIIIAIQANNSISYKSFSDFEET